MDYFCLEGVYAGDELGQKRGGVVRPSFYTGHAELYDVSTDRLLERGFVQKRDLSAWLCFIKGLHHQEMDLGDEGDIATRSLIKALRINAEYRILDALGGYRGKLITEEIERTTHVIEEPKKKGIL